MAFVDYPASYNHTNRLVSESYYVRIAREKTNFRVYTAANIELELPKAQVIIYLDSAAQEIEFCEQRRISTLCIAIDFKALGLDPRTCLDSIEELMVHAQLTRAHYGIKSFLVFLANQDNQSLFALLPPEVAALIALNYHQLSSTFYKAMPSPLLKEYDDQENSFIKKV
jgi:hypothetical protein